LALLGKEFGKSQFGAFDFGLESGQV